MPSNLSLMMRFLRKIEVDSVSGCWIWPSPRRAQGYSQMPAGVSAKSRLGHRWSYEHFVGPIPAGLTIDHLCRNQACVNPLHMEPVSRSENVMRGVSPPALNSKRTHCKRGHEFTPDNTIVSSGGRHRRCRECLRIWRLHNR